MHVLIYNFYPQEDINKKIKSVNSPKTDTASKLKICDEMIEILEKDKNYVPYNEADPNTFKIHRVEKPEFKNIETKLKNTLPSKWEKIVNNAKWVSLPPSSSLALFESEKKNWKNKATDNRITIIYELISGSEIRLRNYFIFFIKTIDKSHRYIYNKHKLSLI